MKKSFIRKLALVMAIIIVLASALMVSASASIVGGNYSGRGQVNHNGSYSYTSFNVGITFPNITNKTRHVGSSTTEWTGTSPYYADSIVHRNIVSVTALGGLSISASGGGGSISGNQMIDEMSVKNKWYIDSKFDYTIKAAIAILSTNFGTSGRVQIGSNFYSISAST